MSHSFAQISKDYRQEYVLNGGVDRTSDVLPISGESGDNFTGVTLGGLEVSSSAYLTIVSRVADPNLTMYTDAVLEQFPPYVEEIFPFTWPEVQGWYPVDQPPDDPNKDPSGSDIGQLDYANQGASSGSQSYDGQHFSEYVDLPNPLHDSAADRRYM